MGKISTEWWEERWWFDDDATRSRRLLTKNKFNDLFNIMTRWNLINHFFSHSLSRKKFLFVISLSPRCRCCYCFSLFFFRSFAHNIFLLLSSPSQQLLRSSFEAAKCEGYRCHIINSEDIMDGTRATEWRDSCLSCVLHVSQSNTLASADAEERCQR